MRLQSSRTAKFILLAWSTDFLQVQLSEPCHRRHSHQGEPTHTFATRRSRIPRITVCSIAWDCPQMLMVMLGSLEKVVTDFFWRRHTYVYTHGGNYSRAGAQRSAQGSSFWLELRGRLTTPKCPEWGSSEGHGGVSWIPI